MEHPSLHPQRTGHGCMQRRQLVTQGEAVAPVLPPTHMHTHIPQPPPSCRLPWGWIPCRLDRAPFPPIQKKLSETVVEDPTQLARAAKDLIQAYDREAELQRNIMQLQRDLTAADRYERPRCEFVRPPFKRCKVLASLGDGGHGAQAVTLA